MARRCAACRYNKHVELCHIKAIADFPSSTTVAEVNDPSNLVFLCPNHHWELDAGLISSRDWCSASIVGFQPTGTG